MSDAGAVRKRTLWDKYVERMTAPNPYPVIDVSIPMRDGLELAASISLPHRSERPAPAIVTITPYDKASFLGSGTEAEFFQRHGYVFVLVDCRGRGKSDGAWTPFVNDAADGHDVIEWVAAQPWCTGKVGMTGLGYDAWAALAAASSRPEHLTCLIASAAPSPGMPDDGLGGSRIGALTGRRGGTGVSAFNPGIAAPAQSTPTADLCYDAIDSPCLHVNGWYDLECLASGIDHYRQMVSQSPAADRQRLIVGPWSHQQTRRPHHTHGGVFFGEAAAPDLNHVHRRWFEYWLMGVENGALAEAPVQLFEPGSYRWIESDRWPLPSAELALAFGFDGDGGWLGREAGVEHGTRSIRFAPNAPTPDPFVCFRYPFEDPPLDQRPWETRDDVLTWTTAPLTQELEISGWPAVELVVSGDRDQVAFRVMLTDVSPDGASHRVAHGWLRGACNGSGGDGALAIDLGRAQHSFAVGHRLRVSVAVDTTSARPNDPQLPGDRPVATIAIVRGSLRLPVTRGGL